MITQPMGTSGTHKMIWTAALVVVVGILSFLSFAHVSNAQAFSLQAWSPQGLPTNNAPAALHDVLGMANVDPKVASWITMRSHEASFSSANYKADGYHIGASGTSNTGLSIVDGSVVDTADTPECNAQTSLMFVIEDVHNGIKLYFCTKCVNGRDEATAVPPAPHEFVSGTTVSVNEMEHETVHPAICGVKTTITVTATVKGTFHVKTWGELFGKVHEQFSKKFSKKISVQVKHAKCPASTPTPTPTPPPAPSVGCAGVVVNGICNPVASGPTGSPSASGGGTTTGSGTSTGAGAGGSGGSGGAGNCAANGGGGGGGGATTGSGNGGSGGEGGNGGSASCQCANVDSVDSTVICTPTTTVSCTPPAQAVGSPPSCVSPPTVSPPSIQEADLSTPGHIIADAICSSFTAPSGWSTSFVFTAHYGSFAGSPFVNAKGQECDTYTVSTELPTASTPPPLCDGTQLPSGNYDPFYVVASSTDPVSGTTLTSPAPPASGVCFGYVPIVKGAGF